MHREARWGRVYTLAQMGIVTHLLLEQLLLVVFFMLGLLFA
jgi:hypothetical protein